MAVIKVKSDILMKYSYSIKKEANRFDDSKSVIAPIRCTLTAYQNAITAINNANNAMSSIGSDLLQDADNISKAAHKLKDVDANNAKAIRG